MLIPERVLPKELTPDQAVEAAYEMGYFEVPKRANAAEIAAEIGVSKSAFLERLRRAQATVFERMLE